ncbi:MAG: histidine phosphatase family protein [Phycisphaerales bacterium]|nr:histidine phosphatase family protein [Phycisphaerales bacterium]
MPKPSRYTIILLKACTTGWDDQDRLCGITDLPPTDESLINLTNATCESSSINDLRSKMSTILCGPSDIAMQCARILAGSHDAKIKANDNLSELDLGLWEGVLRSDLEDRFPSVYTQWITQPGTVAPPDGESLEAVQERVLAQLFKSLRKLKSEHPIVGLVLRPYAWAVLKCWLDQKPLSDVWEHHGSPPMPESFTLDREVVDSHCARKTKIA